MSCSFPPCCCVNEAPTRTEARRSEVVNAPSAESVLCSLFVVCIEILPLVSHTSAFKSSFEQISYCNCFDRQFRAVCGQYDLVVVYMTCSTISTYARFALELCTSLI